MRNQFLCHMRTTQDTEEPAHLQYLIGVFVVHCLSSIHVVTLFAISKISRLQLTFVAELAGSSDSVRMTQGNFLMTGLKYKISLLSGESLFIYCLSNKSTVQYSHTVISVFPE